MGIFSFFHRHLLVAFCARLLVGLLLAGYILTRFDLSQIAAALTSVDLAWLSASLVLTLLIRLLWAYQMFLCAAPLSMSVRAADLLKINLISSFYTLILPGELASGGVSWLKLYQKERKGVEAGILLLHFRLVTVSSLILAGMAGLYLDPEMPFPFLRHAGLLLSGAVLSIMAAFSIPAFTKFTENTVQYFWKGRKLPAKLEKGIHLLWNAVTALQDMPLHTVLSIYGLAFLSQILGILNYYLLSRAAEIHVALAALIWIRTFLYILSLFPISLNGLGVREVSLLILLEPYQVPSAYTISFSLLIYGVSVLVGLIGGLLELKDFILQKLKPEPGYRVNADDRGSL
jgi:uncharacterized protein (TIRG00374 family)